MKRTPKPAPTLTVTEGLTAEQTLIAFLDRIGWDGRAVVREFLDVHAHELAEKQRAFLRHQGYAPDEEPCPCGGCSWCLAQDYIDLTDPYAQD